MFFGQYKHAADEKGRLRIPAKLKNSLESNYVITKGTNNCLFVFNKSYFSTEFLNKLSQVPTFSKNGQKPVRAILSSCYDVEEDNQGRFLLPAFLKDHVKFKKNVIFIGAGNRIEIWEEEAWNKYMGSEDDFDSVVEELQSFNV